MVTIVKREAPLNDSMSGGRRTTETVVIALRQPFENVADGIFLGHVECY